MSDTRTLLSKIGALRQRLEQAHRLAREARKAAESLADGPSQVLPLDQSVKLGAEADEELSRAVRPASEVLPPAVPRQLTARARSVLEAGVQLLAELREASGELANPAWDETDEAASLKGLSGDALSMMDMTVRSVAMMPDSASAQMQMCRGLEAIVEDVADRLRILKAGVARLRRRAGQTRLLESALTALETGQPCRLDELRTLAAELALEAENCEPLDLRQHPRGTVAERVATHSLAVARVMARVAPHARGLNASVADAVLAALLHDVGMLAVPTVALECQGKLDDAGRRSVEAHVHVGKQCLLQALRDLPHVRDAIACHHERQDGTGYPDGLRGENIPPLARLLAVCDTYAALAAARPHRPAHSTRAALAETLLLAEQGSLDQEGAALLLRLSFYPAGTLVELASGAFGVVVAAGDPALPARPVVAVLTDARGCPLPRPWHLDLSRTDAHSIVRSLSPSQKRQALGRQLARWAA
jgi:HD-GYP domain-containing protein (c-di-GMP phosphodiesterase class II)